MSRRCLFTIYICYIFSLDSTGYCTDSHCKAVQILQYFSQDIGSIAITHIVHDK